MTSREFRDRLNRRLERAGVKPPDADAIAKLEAYFTLLGRWNSKINLTALPLDKPTDETIDRLLTEPLAAARHFPAGARTWFDLGTGGGSPAIPLKIVKPGVSLTMVESKVRKAAFLREAVRALELPRSSVENARFEEVAVNRPGSADLVTVRAVRTDSTLFKVAGQLLKATGHLLLFCSSPDPTAVGGFTPSGSFPLTDSRTTYLSLYSRA